MLCSQLYSLSHDDEISLQANASLISSAYSSSLALPNVARPRLSARSRDVIPSLSPIRKTKKTSCWILGIRTTRKLRLLIEFGFAKRRTAAPIGALARCYPIARPYKKNKKDILLDVLGFEPPVSCAYSSSFAKAKRRTAMLRIPVQP